VRDGKIGVGHQRTIGFPAQEHSIAHDEEAAVGQLVEAQRKRRNLGDDFAVAVGVQRDDLLRRPVGEQQPAIVPARRLEQATSRGQGLHFRH
jgi:hypothetical protein